MSYYKHEEVEKSYAKLAESKDAILKASMSLAPNKSYSKDTIYKVEGVGKIFEGSYNLTKITHIISSSGYTVNAEGIKVPDVPPAPTAKPAKPKEAVKVKADKLYTVIKGDTLSGIASKLCGKTSDWMEIEKANRAQLVAKDKRNASDKGHWIFPGQKLKIPGLVLK